MIKPVAIRKSALDDYRTMLRVAKQEYGEVEIGCLSLAHVAKPDEIARLELIRGQNVSAIAFEASEEAVLETLHALDEQLVWQGLCHSHPASGPFGHSAEDKNIEEEMLPLIALARTPRSYLRHELEPKLDVATGGRRYFLDPLERASILVHGAGKVTLELGVSEGSATSLVMLAPDYQSRIFALRQRHRFIPMLSGSNQELFHEQWNEEPIVEITQAAEAHSPLEEEEALAMVRRWVWASPKVIYSIPRLPAPPRLPTPTRPLARSARDRVRENLQRTLADARALMRSVVELASERMEDW